ncbi:MAG: 1-acyl-sn-glycerol-3-phosphate acyltransferase [Leptolyngbyaceae cyanobacterium SM2_5_2]|nr:1-acyl-sn-glycerol-3-phosphate acyltransferase [Leptolyngbyaceae cyanobacterium SM2_5_2]
MVSALPYSSALSPLTVSNGLLNLLGVNVSIAGQERIPENRPLVLVSNHRSILDAPLLMQATGRSVRFACHYYMSQVPGLREIVTALGCLPLDASGRGQTKFFRRALKALSQGEAVGIFPEGAAPMVHKTAPDNLNAFHRGFAQLALRAPVEELTIVPVAIASRQETSNAVVPLRFLSRFDDSEPLFQQPGWHPAVMYQEVKLLIGHPVRVDDRLRSRHRSKDRSHLVADITQCCQEEIATLLKHAYR